MTTPILYFVCRHCDDRFLMDEDYVEVPDPTGGQRTRRAGLDYQGRDCRCPICEQFTGQLAAAGGETNQREPGRGGTSGTEA